MNMEDRLVMAQPMIPGDLYSDMNSTIANDPRQSKPRKRLQKRRLDHQYSQGKPTPSDLGDLLFPSTSNPVFLDCKMLNIQSEELQAAEMKEARGIDYPRRPLLVRNSAYTPSSGADTEHSLESTTTRSRALTWLPPELRGPEWYQEAELWLKEERLKR